MQVSFELSMPNNNSWNGKWTGDGECYCVIRTMKEPPKLGRYSYNFGDGSGPQYCALRCKCCGFQLHTSDAGVTWMYRIGSRKEEKLFVLLPGDISQEKLHS